ncbi:ketol-acid reductoisomerase [Oecophyllibacter saccharovorans]|uniref:ketol-acid reductoisomerase n=1 Tax=Oecophyllibacter saccharovorans TaxID=2558360 RepID=UPI00116868B9|nr:ketol-acid reductoisomerase [Oecophyllibacter saccharovorans]TPW33734.1 ketol-acid reductoisomerase [Oecophyllibacter saccharovorans]
MRVYYDRDADVSLICNRRVAVIGYGSQGAAQAANLRDSGVTEMVIGLRPGSPSAERARADGFEVITPEEAAQWADVVMVMTPDEGHGTLYRDVLAPRLRQGAALGFAHGLAVHYGLIEPRADLDVFLIGPKGPGTAVRQEYLKGGGVMALVAVAQNASGQALELALAYAAANGMGRAGIIETSFREETETDLFGEQAVLCGGAMELVKAGFETLVEAGYAPEMAYLECVHELKLVVDLLYAGGLPHASGTISNTAEYGAYVSGPRVITDAARQGMKDVLADIQNGTFVRNFLLETQSGSVGMKAARRRDRAQLMEQVGSRLRRMIPGLNAAQADPQVEPSAGSVSPGAGD